MPESNYELVTLNKRLSQLAAKGNARSRLIDCVESLKDTNAKKRAEIDKWKRRVTEYCDIIAVDKMYRDLIEAEPEVLERHFEKRYARGLQYCGIDHSKWALPLPAPVPKRPHRRFNELVPVLATVNAVKRTWRGIFRKRINEKPARSFDEAYKRVKSLQASSFQLNRLEPLDDQVLALTTEMNNYDQEIRRLKQYHARLKKELPRSLRKSIHEYRELEQVYFNWFGSGDPPQNTPDTIASELMKY